MRIGVYIDAFNLYYGARGLCGRGTAGWRWIDPRALAEHVVATASTWSNPTVTRVVYCTAMVSGASNPSGAKDQNVYVRALKAGQHVDHIELGNYVARVATAPLATEDKKHRPTLVTPSWPIMVQDGSKTPVTDAKFIVSVAKREEKGSDVNVASHLLIDTLNKEIDAAVVISNDSDLEFHMNYVRQSIPIGTVNPTNRYLAGKLRGNPSDGVGDHWWYQLSAADIRASQMPPTVGNVTRPQGW